MMMVLIPNLEKYDKKGFTTWAPLRVAPGGG